MIEIITSVEFWKFSAPIFGAIIAWGLNEWRKRVWEQHQRKEESYKALLHSLKGFYEGTEDSTKLKQEFLDQLNYYWLYCPDDVIEKGYGFLDSVQAQNKSSNEIQENRMGDFVASIRRDLLSQKLVKNTNLNGKDFKILKVT